MKIEHTRVYKRMGLSLLFVLFTVSCHSKEPEAVRLYAGAGLRDAVEALRAEFEERTGTTVDVDYAGSGVVLARVQDDPQADLFMPGDVWYVDRLNELTGLVQESTPVARLIPVLIVAEGNPKKITGLDGLMRLDVRAALGSPKACQIGRLSQRILDRAGLKWDQVADKESLTVNELVVWVKMNAVDAAIVWDSTAAAAADQLDIISLDLQPSGISSVACALLKSSTNPKAAHAFVRFMAGAEGQQIFEENGFTRAEKIE